MDGTGEERTKFFYVATVPESEPAGRHVSADVSGWSDYSGARSGAELRLYAWSELPEAHRNEICRQIRVRCEAFISSMRVQKSQRRSEIDSLVSEVVAHLLRATSLSKEATMDSSPTAVQPNPCPQAASAERSNPLPWLEKGQINLYEPPRDARVIWIVEDTCNRQALFHRYEDVRRRDRGGKWDGSGYPLVAVDDQTIEQLSGHYDPGEQETDPLEDEDARRAWDGLVQLTSRQFGIDDDVVALVQVLASDSDTQESFGSQWPIGKIVRALNARQSRTSWNDDRVENAKRRLTRFMGRLKQAHGLDAIDLRALLVRYSRERQAVARAMKFSAVE